MAGTGGGGPIVARALTATIARTSTSLPGSVAAGKRKVRINNIGSADGTVLGTLLSKSVSASPILEATYTEFEGYWDNELNEFVRLPAIAYDATGTTFVIETID